MKTIFALYLKYLLYWLLIFVLGRLFFHFMNYEEFTGLGLGATLGSFIYGFRLDLSMSAYLCLIPFLVLSVLLFIFKLKVQILNNILHFMLLIPALLVITIDARLYRYWGFKLDLTPFRFIKGTSKEAAASIRGMDILVVSVVFVVLLLLGIWLYKKWIHNSFVQLKRTRGNGFVGLILSVILFLPIRGSVDVAPISVSSAYFHENHFANQAAVNPVWNFLYSITIFDQDQDLQLTSSNASEGLVQKLYQPSADSSFWMPSWADKKPNIIILALESFSGKLVEPLGGINGLTPQLNKLCESGILFENYYASGDRSDIGLATMFTGFPAMPHKHLLAFPQKLSRLPNLYQLLAPKGYSSSFFYGGNLEFANINSLFITGGVQNIITQKEMPKLPSNGKWGIHDEHVFEYFGDYLENESEPFISAMFSLSSHEPYVVPAEYQKFKGNLKDFNTAVYYTDSCLGELISSFKKSGVWDNSLVVITADHANRMPDLSAVNHPNKFHIPLLLTGGVVDTTLKYSHHCSQSDLAYTIISLFDQNESLQQQFPFSKNLFDKTKDFACYFYNNGVGYLDKTGGIVYDITGDYTTLLQGEDSLKYVTRAKSFGQAISDEFKAR